MLFTRNIIIMSNIKINVNIRKSRYKGRKKNNLKNNAGYSHEIICLNIIFHFNKKKL